MRSVTPICLALGAVLSISTPAEAGSWKRSTTLQGAFAVSSPPEAPVVAVNARGHAVSVWADTGDIRYSDRSALGLWSRSARVRTDALGGPAAVAIGPDETTAVAWVTVATRYVPSKLLVSVRPPGGTFGVPFELAPGTAVGNFDLGITAAGAVHAVWQDASGVEARMGSATGVWSAVTRLSDPAVGAAAPDLKVDDAGDAVVAWLQGASGGASAVGAAYLHAGGTWEPPVIVSSGSGQTLWNPIAALDVSGDAAIGYLDGTQMVVATRLLAGPWSAARRVSGVSQVVYYPALAVDDAGELLAAWQVLDASNNGAIWISTGLIGGTWTTPGRLSARTESAGWPTATFSRDGTVAAIAWVDDLGLSARVAIGKPGAPWLWTKAIVGTGSWGSIVPVEANGGVVAASWATQLQSNPNAALILGRAWE